jgi:hypothetical protein
LGRRQPRWTGMWTGLPAALDTFGRGLLASVGVTCSRRVAKPATAATRTPSPTRRYERATDLIAPVLARPV